MDSNELIQIARECGADVDGYKWSTDRDYTHEITFTADALQQFAQRIREAALLEAAEVCKKISDEYKRQESHRHAYLKADAETGLNDCADTLRKMAEGNP